VNRWPILPSDAVPRGKLARMVKANATTLRPCPICKAPTLDGRACSTVCKNSLATTTKASAT
jgi:hypothetical protein